MTVHDDCFDKKFLEKSNLNLIKVENDVDLNRFVSLSDL